MAAVELSQLKDRIAKSSSLDFKTARRFLQLARENSLRESELVVQCGKRVLQSVSSLGDECTSAHQAITHTHWDCGFFLVCFLGCTQRTQLALLLTALGNT
jgi:hypothetical protein